jgi:hypothetical protein
MSLVDRFISHIEKTDSCWLWKGAKPNRYPSFRVDKNTIRKSHKLSYEMFNGNVPDGMCVLHKCDNPNCVNPEHLWLGTKADNNKDRSVKGRSAPSPTQVLNVNQVKEIRAMYAPRKTTQAYIASLYGVTRSAIRAITSGKNWSKV